MKDLECPYCGHGQEVCHDDGFGYEEDRLHEDECSKCGKAFVFHTTIVMYYEAYKADCLNEGGEHKYKSTHTYPSIFAKLKCEDCESTKAIHTDEEIEEYFRNKEKQDMILDRTAPHNFAIAEPKTTLEDVFGELYK